MSWDSYRDSLVGSGHVAKAALCGYDGSVWTQTEGFDLRPDEVKVLVGGFTNTDSLRSNGIRLGGQKYFYLQSDDSQIQGKQGSGGCSVAKSNQCVVIGVYAEGMQPGNARATVETIRDHLLKHNY